MHIPAARARERNFWKENQELDGGKWKWSRPITSKSGFLEQLWFSPFNPHSLSHIAFLLSKKSPTLPHDRHPLAKIDFTRTDENFSQIQMRTTFYSSSQFRKGSKFRSTERQTFQVFEFLKNTVDYGGGSTLLYRTWNCIKIDASNSQKASLKKQEFSSETLTHTHTADAALADNQLWGAYSSSFFFARQQWCRAKKVHAECAKMFDSNVQHRSPGWRVKSWKEKKKIWPRNILLKWEVK